MFERYYKNNDGIHINQDDYLPIDWEASILLIDYLDDFMSRFEVGRSASSEHDKIDEWCESAMIMADVNNDFSYQWPLTESKLIVRRTEEKGSQAFGQTYNIIFQWQVLGQELIDPYIVKSYILDHPIDDSEDPKLLVCTQQSPFFRSIHGELDLVPENNDSNYYEADKLLFDNFVGKLAVGTQFDCEELLNNLSLFCQDKNTK